MRKSLFVLAIATTLGACFGEGPAIGQPSAAQVVFFVTRPSSDNPCGNNTFIGSVGIGGAPQGYVVTIPYQPQSCGGGMANGPIEVFSFGKTTSSVDNLGSPGATSGTNFQVHAAANATTGFWGFASPGTSALTVQTVGGTVGTVLASNTGQLSVAGLAADPSSIYIATAQSNGGGGDGPNSPRFPCCGSLASPSTGGGIYQLSATAMNAIATPVVASANLFTDSMPEPFVGTGSALFYLETGGGTAATLTQIDVDTAGTATATTHTPITLQGKPFGIAADAGHVAWSTTLDFSSFGNGASGAQDQCTIYARPIGSQAQPSPLLSTTKFSCLGVAVDADAVYFAIAHVETVKSEVMIHGDGIGRIPFATPSQFESIALGIQGVGTGPRRIFLDGDDIYAIDPFEIGKLAKQALRGKADFTP
ncbi:MAG: hypothetical protein JWO36_6988 [Myxococcales bacterium]|nr:hypothetical protein [Myxococcales bacterium]